MYVPNSIFFVAFLSLWHTLLWLFYLALFSFIYLLVSVIFIFYFFLKAGFLEIGCRTAEGWQRIGFVGHLHGAGPG